MEENSDKKIHIWTGAGEGGKSDIIKYLVQIIIENNVSTPDEIMKLYNNISSFDQINKRKIYKRLYYINE